MELETIYETRWFDSNESRSGSGDNVLEDLLPVSCLCNSILLYIKHSNFANFKYLVWGICSVINHVVVWMKLMEKKDIAQNKQNCWHFQIRVHRFDEVFMRVRGRGRERAGQNLIIYCFIVAIFFSQSAYKGDWESKRFGLFQRTYFMDSTLAKDSTTNISAISQLLVLIHEICGIFVFSKTRTKLRLALMKMFPVLVIL